MNNENYTAFFGMTREPYGSDLTPEDILMTDGLVAVKKRFDYALRLGGVGVITGEIGSGKSTALRYTMSALHPSAYMSLYVTATTGSVLELYRQITDVLCLNLSSNSKVVMTRAVKKEVVQLVEDKKIKPVLVVDEASLLRLEVFQELHTLCQFHKDSKPYLTLILSGQASLVDKLMYRNSASLASRVITRTHLESLNLEDMGQYLRHHAKIAGLANSPFDDNAVVAIHQGSGGLLRKANHLARGSLIAAASAKSQTVNVDHVQLASTEIF